MSVVNDANIKPLASDLADLGIDVLNWSHRFAIPDVLHATGGKLCLMGNVAPLELGVGGSPEAVKAAALGHLAAGRKCESGNRTRARRRRP